MKSAYRAATEKKSSGVILNRLLHRAFFVAKRVRSETGIGDHAVSISYAAIELGRKIFGGLDDKAVLLVGAGEMAELAVEHLIRNRVGKVSVANRTFDRAVELARRFHGEALHMEEIPHVLTDVDIIIGSTGAPGYVISREEVKSVGRKRKNRPLFFIDIAVPRDIDPEINKLPNAYVYDIDDLKIVVEENIEDRSREAIKAQRIVDEAVIRFREWFESLDVVPTVISLRNRVEELAASELEKVLQTGRFTEKDEQLVQRMVHNIVNKILHEPTVALKKHGCKGDKSAYIDLARKLFNLDPE
jgi:glutamyl-tRNA reductase